MCANKRYLKHKQKDSIVKFLIGNNMFTSDNIKKLSYIFDCSKSSITAARTRVAVKSDVTIYTSQNMRNKIRKRDGMVCCYCGDCSEDNEYVVEHVIPYELGGHAREYNLVMACQSCNVTKGTNTWIPQNFKLLQSINSEWSKKIEKLAINYR